MKTVGLIGGIAPESTIEYYRLIIAGYRAYVTDGSYPSIVINSIDLKAMLDLVQTREFVRLTRYLVGEIHKLARAGAELGLLASNTPHIVFDEIGRQSPIPLVSIVEATCAAARTLGLTRLGLIGTRFTMQGQFYPKVFSKAQIALVTPAPDDQAYIHDKYMNELVPGVLLPETRAGLLAIVDRLREHERIDGLILGGTELPLILGDTTGGNGPGNVTGRGIPFLDTTRIHVQALLARLWDE
jgi:aspartate racemase